MTFDQRVEEAARVLYDTFHSGVGYARSWEHTLTNKARWRFAARTMLLSIQDGTL